MIWNDSNYFQGQALQDLFYLHFRDEMRLDWVERGKRKPGRDPDRLEVEEYKLQQDHEKLQKTREADIAEANERNRIVERTGDVAEKARNKLLADTLAKVDIYKEQIAEAEKRALDAQTAEQTAKTAQLDAEIHVKKLQARTERIKDSEKSVQRRVDRLTYSAKIIAEKHEGTETYYERAFSALTDVLRKLLPNILWEKIVNAYQNRVEELKKVDRAKVGEAAPALKPTPSYSKPSGP